MRSVILASRISHPVLLRAFSQPYRSVHRLESKQSPPAPDRPVQAPGSKPPCDHQREVGLDVPVDGGSPHLGGKTGRKIEGDPAVHGTELEGIAPGGATERTSPFTPLISIDLP